MTMLKVIIVLTAIICSSYAASVNVSDEDGAADALGLVTSRETRDTLGSSELLELNLSPVANCCYE